MGTNKRAYPADTDLAVEMRGGAPICKRSRLWSSDDYEKTGELGKGGFLCNGASFAVKKPLRCPHEEEDGDDDRITCNCSDDEDTLREAAFLSACQGHRAIVELRAISRDAVNDDRLSLVLDCVGPSLSDVLHGHPRHSQPFTEAEVRCIMRQLLGGAKHMHARRVVHRDIKPENILVGRGGIEEDVKICGMGLAVSMSEPPPYDMRRGTYRYMAPEMILGKTDYDAMVDMWSLGCVMAELLTGKALFDADADTDGDTLLAIFRVLGVPLFTTWPAYRSLPLAGKLVTPPRVIPRNKLRQHFPEELLSDEGFQVLRGLLSCNIDKRLSATAALRRPWFANVDDAPT